MTLVKIDSGDYINTDKINRVYTTECMDLLGDRGIHDEIHASFDSEFVEITPADRGRIVEAMAVQSKKLRLEVMALERRLTV